MLYPFTSEGKEVNLAKYVIHLLYRSFLTKYYEASLTYLFSVWSQLPKLEPNVVGICSYLILMMFSLSHQNITSTFTPSQKFQCTMQSIVYSFCNYILFMGAAISLKSYCCTAIFPVIVCLGCALYYKVAWHVLFVIESSGISYWLTLRGLFLCTDKVINNSF